MTSQNSIILPFAKMQALGNDFIVIDAERLLESSASKKLLERWEQVLPTLAHTLCSRRFGIGGDGLILALNLKQKELALLASQLYGANLADCKLAWTYTNRDGFSPQTCGNGLRCLALWAYRKGLIKDRLRVLTAAGPVEITFQSEERITADLGQPYLAAEQIPYTGVKKGQNVVGSPFAIGNEKLSITCVNMGNPHCLIFSGGVLEKLNIELPFSDEDKLQELPSALSLLAADIQSDPRFPESVNVSFVLAHDRGSASAVVFERGCGPTLACGSAACAILVGGVLEDRLLRQAKITLPGGNLLTDWSLEDNHVRISGPARLVYEGQFSLNLSFLDIANKATRLGAGQR